METRKSGTMRWIMESGKTNAANGYDESGKVHAVNRAFLLMKYDTPDTVQPSGNASTQEARGRSPLPVLALGTPDGRIAGPCRVFSVRWWNRSGRESHPSGPPGRPQIISDNHATVARIRGFRSSAR